MQEKGRFTLGRRDFLRAAGIGAGAAAVGVTVKGAQASAAAAAPAAAPSFEATKFADPAGRLQRPWWVKTVDVPTTEIDWEMMQQQALMEVVQQMRHIQFLKEIQVTMLKLSSMVCW